MGLEPLDTLGVEVVGRLVEEEDIRLAEQEAAECHAPSLATAEIGHQCIRRRALESIHRPFQLRIDLPSAAMLDLLGQLSLPLDQGVHLVVVHRLAELQVHLLIFPKQVHHFLDTLLDHLEDCLVRVHLRLLLQIAHGVARSPYHLALETLLHSGDDLHQCGFSGAVETDDADFRPVKE